MNINILKRIFYNILIVIIITLLLSGCRTIMNNSNTTQKLSLQSMQTITPITEKPQKQNTNAVSPSRSEFCIQPSDSQIVKNNNDTINYQGQYRYIAEDGKKTNYPKWEVNKTVQINDGEITVPSDWILADSHFINLQGKTMLFIEIENFDPDPTVRYYGVLPNHSDLISWDTLPDNNSFKMYTAALESDEPAASGDNTITIRKLIYFKSNINGVYNGHEYYYGYLLGFNKAFINGDKIDYEISNQTIEEIVNSFKPNQYDTK